MIAFDIETSGLEPKTDKFRAYSWSDGKSVHVEFGEEKDLLQRLEDLMTGPLSGKAKYTWNGDEFDIPFLHERYRHWFGVGRQGPSIQPTGAYGKYGKPLYRGSWNGACIDIAPAYKAFAEKEGIKWSLKPVAEKLGFHPLMIPAPADAALDVLVPYSASDAFVTLQLARAAINDILYRG